VALFYVGAPAVPPVSHRFDRVDACTAARLAAPFLLVGSLSGVQTAVKTQQIAVSDADYRTGVWLEAYADERDLQYPDNYVLSRWGTNRLDNYLVNGETESYDYAQANYERFVGSPTTEGWYRQFAEDDVGFMLVRGGADLPESTVYGQLTAAYGSQTATNGAVEHFRAIYASGDDDRFVYAVVPGATVTGTAEPGSTVTAETTVTLPPANTSVTYTQDVQVGSDGRYQFTTPYPGRYTVGETEVSVPESAVVDGESVSASP
jgi:dolichyl-diphosphooligosaccharide--protein glycosyltransferase